MMAPEDILADLIKTTPGEEGKWFATAKDLKLYELALQLADQSPCEPKTLNRAARDFLESEPEFAFGAAMAALESDQGSLATSSIRSVLTSNGGWCLPGQASAVRPRTSIWITMTIGEADYEYDKTTTRHCR